MGVNSSQAGDVLSASATRPPLDAASASPLSLLLYRRRIRAGPAAAAASDSSVDERTMRTIEAAALNADIFARGESDHARPTFDRVALLWTPHDEMFAAHAEAQEATLPQHLVATPRQCAHHAAAASSIVRSSARDISLGIATDVQRYLPPASTLPRVTLDKDDDTLALADASQNSRLPIDPARCMVFEAVVNHGVTKSSAFSVRCVTLDEILSSDCVCAAVRPLALDGYSLIKQNRFDARKPAPEFVSPTGLLQWSDRGLCVYREWERVLDAFKASVLPRLLPSDRDASQVRIAPLSNDLFEENSPFMSEMSCPFLTFDPAHPIDSRLARCARICGSARTSPPCRHFAHL